jgi:hypothetical protein
LSNQPFNRATHFSIIWGVTLAVLTLLEWRTLDRDPIGHQILTPFIERDIVVGLDPSAVPEDVEEARGLPDDLVADDVLQYQVDIRFNGPLFLACFFGPVLAFLGLGKLYERLKKEG